MPASQARRLCPHAIVLPPDFDAYRATSREVWEIVDRAARRAPAPRARRGLRRPDGRRRSRCACCASWSPTVLERTGISLSVGVAPEPPDREDLQRPRQAAGVRRDGARGGGAALRRRIRRAACRGSGRRRPSACGRSGSRRSAQLQRMPGGASWRRASARATAASCTRSAWFHDDSPVSTSRVLKSRSNERTFDEDIASLAELEEILRRLARELCEGLAARGKRGRTIGIKVRLDDWTNVTRARTIEAPTCDVERRDRHRARAAARLRAAAAGAPARRADGVVRGRGGGGGDERAPPADQLALPIEAARSVERGGEAPARVARERVLDAELVEDADDDLADLVLRAVGARQRARSAGRARARGRPRRARRTRRQVRRAGLLQLDARLQSGAAEVPGRALQQRERLVVLAARVQQARERHERVGAVRLQLERLCAATASSPRGDERVGLGRQQRVEEALDLGSRLRAGELGGDAAVLERLDGRDPLDPEGVRDRRVGVRVELRERDLAVARGRPPAPARASADGTARTTRPRSRRRPASCASARGPAPRSPAR